MKENIDVTLAVYTERLDGYISGQNKLNTTLVESLEKLNNEVSDLQDWKHRVHGARSGSIAMGVLVFHTVIILGAMTGIGSWINSR